MGNKKLKIGIKSLPLPPSHLYHLCGPLFAITKKVWRALNWGQWGRNVKLSHPVTVNTKFTSLFLFTFSLIQ
jgi:hypothetical protein